MKNIWDQRMIGKVFGRLTILRYTGKTNRSGNKIVVCQCICGNIIQIRNVDLYKVKSCGCYALEKATKHGFNRTKKRDKFYSIWSGAKDRCVNKNNPRYKNYGGRGITFDENWKKNFINFYYDMHISFIKACLKFGYNNVSIERKDVNQGYNKNNCIWIPIKDQGLNTTRTKPILVISLKTKEQKEFKNQKEAVQYLHLTSSHVSECLYGKRKSHKGFKFEFLN